MTDFIKLTQITNWKIEKEKKEPITTKSVYVRPQDIVSFGDDDGTTLVQFADKGIHVKESAEEIYEMIRGYKLTYKGNPIREYKNKEFFDDDFWWNTPFHATWTNADALNNISKNTPYYGYAIVFGNGEVWE